MIQYQGGDATNCQQNSILIHVCNNVGAWGAGFVLAISNRWLQPEVEYRAWSKRRGGTLPLGHVQFVNIPKKRIIVANMIGQTLGKTHPPIKYWAVAKCLAEVGRYADATGRPVAAPMFGAGLAGGEWRIIESLIETFIPDHIPVTVYDFNKEPKKLGEP